MEGAAKEFEEMFSIFYDFEITAWKVPKYGVISGSYLPVFSPNTQKYRPEITGYLDTFQVVNNWL